MQQSKSLHRLAGIPVTAFTCFTLIGCAGGGSGVVLKSDPPGAEIYAVPNSVWVDERSQAFVDGLDPFSKYYVANADGKQQSLVAKRYQFIAKFGDEIVMESRELPPGGRAKLTFTKPVE